MKITWHGHACFEVESLEGTVVFDTFEDGSVPGIRNLQLKANALYSSHKHGDHYAPQVVELDEKEFNVDYIDTYHDDKQGTLRGNNRIHILHVEDMKVVHLGDLGCELTGEQVSKIKYCDVLMIPVGGFFTIDAKMAKDLVNKVNPKVTIPMHYSSETFGYNVIARVDDFTRLCDDVVLYDDRVIEVTKETPKQTAVLTYK